MTAGTVRGTGLHTGVECAVRLIEEPGPIRFRQGASEATLDALTVVRADRGVRVRAGELEIELVEHLLAALGGLGIYEGVVLEVEGPEVPLMDGASAAFCDALARLDMVPGAPITTIARAEELEIGDSQYRLEPDDEVSIDVTVDFDEPAIGTQSAHWDGRATSFQTEIASARTFGFKSDADALRARGLATFVDPDVVVVFGAEPEPTLRFPNEPARHKLLDLVGDAFLFGGPPRGRLRATKPGHRANHEMMRRARAEGVIVPC